ncbi:MAG: DUF1659 domain-containing protein, partial [Alicyclobacillus sp.]|nr:DUF1659 domain-containing protein [Alicyclobacillus sp.]
DISGHVILPPDDAPNDAVPQSAVSLHLLECAARYSAREEEATMATATPMSRRLQLQFENGTTATGHPKLKNQNYAHVSPAATDDDVLAVGQALAGLSADTLYQIARLDQASLA